MFTASIISCCFSFFVTMKDLINLFSRSNSFIASLLFFSNCLRFLPSCFLTAVTLLNCSPLASCWIENSDARFPALGVVRGLCLDPPRSSWAAPGRREKMRRLGGRSGRASRASWYPDQLSPLSRWSLLIELGNTDYRLSVNFK